MKELKYVDYTTQYYDELFALQNAQWGEGSDSDEIFENIEKYIIKLALCDNQVVGCLICHEEKEYFYIDMIVISPDFQKMKIGSTFMDIAIDIAKAKKYNKVECCAIEANGHTNSQKLLENFGFVKTQTIPNYWGNLCPDFDCKECGHKPCICTMHHYIKNIWHKKTLANLVRVFCFVI